mgnify:CR=1 FL=1
MDLVILFVKALYSRSALSANRELIGPDTFLMTLQNGSGHEDILSEFVPADHIIIGTTEDNGAVLAPGYVRRGGTGKTNIGMPAGESQRISSKSERNSGMPADFRDRFIPTSSSLSGTNSLLTCP